MFYLCENDEEQELIEAKDFNDPRVFMVGEGGRWTMRSPGAMTKEETFEKLKILPKPCVVCGHLAKTTYHGSEELVEKNMCFGCNLWDKRVKELYKPNVMVVGGALYSIASENFGPFRGFGGRKFIFKRLDNGKTVESTNVWFGGHIPKVWLPKFKDNAIIIN